MKLKDLQAMSEGEQQETLAKMEGWKIDPQCYPPWNWIKPNGDYSRNDEIPDYHHDFNAIVAAEMRVGLHNEENTTLRAKWANNLHAILAPRCPKNSVGTPLVSDIHKMLASASERTQALILTLAP